MLTPEISAPRLSDAEHRVQVLACRSGGPTGIIGSLGRKSNILRRLLLASFRWTDNVETIAGVRLQRRADREPLEGDQLVYPVGSAVGQQDTRPIRGRVAGGAVRVRRR